MRPERNGSGAVSPHDGEEMTLLAENALKSEPASSNAPHSVGRSLTVVSEKGICSLRYITVRICILLTFIVVAGLMALLLLEEEVQFDTWEDALEYMSTNLEYVSSQGILNRGEVRVAAIELPHRTAFEKDEDDLVIGQIPGVIEPTLPTFGAERIWTEELLFGYYPWTEVTKSPTKRPTRAPTLPKTPRPTRRPAVPLIPANRTIIIKKSFRERLKFYLTNAHWPNSTDIDAAVKECDARFDRHKRNPKSEDFEILKADCGLGYKLPSNSSATAIVASPHKKNHTSPAKGDGKWRVFFVGSDWSDPKMLLLSGCPRKCPLSPNCALLYDSEEVAHALDLADVVVTFSSNYLTMRKKPYVPDSVKYRVLYWREASWSGPPLEFQRTDYFSFEMGVHYSAGIINPAFLARPSVLLKGAYLDEPKDGFAASVISDCAAPSKRDDYLRMVMETLSAQGYRVHRYGECGNRELPGKNLQQALKYLARYKFYFSFENTIQAGYVTEKLFTALMLPLVPVFYGSANTPNITRTPSFIRASQFSSPVQLAEYLMYLDKNPKEYARYQEWRTKASPSEAFTKDYIHTMQHRVAGPTEVKLNYQSERTAQCCRLCNEQYVKWATDRPKRESVVNVPMPVEDIDAKYFSGALGKSRR